MSAPSYIKEKCPYCGKIAREAKRQFSNYMQKWCVTLECNHTVFVAAVKAADDQYHIVSSDKRSLMPFQKEGVKFIEKSGGRVLIADEMGLGKTVQALAYLKLHPEACPALIITKASVKMQWFNEVIRWCGIEYTPQIFVSGNERPIEGFNTYIITFDLLRRISGATNKKRIDSYSGLEDWDEEKHVHPLVKFPFKTIIIDETQQIKSSTSLRTKEVRAICKGRENVIGLSGTPAKNNAGEMFSILNILDSKRFPEFKRFVQRFCDQHWSGRSWKIGGIRDLEIFQSYTEDLMIRREMKDVLPELPEINRVFRNVEFTGKGLVKQYKEEQEDFEDWFYNDADKEDFSYITNLLARLSKMRHITGLSKIGPVAEYVMEFLSSTDRKYVVFCHHQDVIDNLALLIEQLIETEKKEDEDNEASIWNTVDSKPLKLVAALNSDQRIDLINEFRDNPRKRVMICSTLASGEGLNMQFVSDAGMMERQWNPANEEQAERRFKRIGMGKHPVNITYFISAGTIDEFFTELVEQKREWINSVFKETESHWDQSSLVKELAAVIAAKGGKKWKVT